MKQVNNYLVLIMMMAFLIPSGTFAQVPVAKKEEVKKEIKVKEVKKTAKAKKPSSADIKKHSSKTLKVGSKGDAVKATQKSLIKDDATANNKGKNKSQDVKAVQETLNGDAAKANSKFGKGTKKGVVDFQKKKKLDADGMTGPKTNAKKVPKTITESMKKKNKKKDNKKKKKLKKDQ